MSSHRSKLLSKNNPQTRLQISIFNYLILKLTKKKFSLFSCLKVKGKIGGLIISIAYLMMFGTVKMFPYILDYMGTQQTFLIFAINSFLGVAFTYQYLPETLGKSFKEIEKSFIRNVVNNEQEEN